uniref:procathepsin L-like isoform X1 n=1 Tax=Styela clava TaxID=7725 RepID=UPI00193ACF2B|nr:procathepsin L-like isoform X1 [Styela clava]
MRILVVVAVYFVVCCLSVSANRLFQSEWEAWKTEHGKSYSYEEENKRQYIWEKNLKKVVDHNMEADNGIHTFRLGMNQFADMDEEEWRILVSSHVTKLTNQGELCKIVNNTNEIIDQSEDDSVDWRTKGFVTPVRNGGTCGASWANSVTGTLEGQHFKNTGMLVLLSEQNLIDCTSSGCRGGTVEQAYAYIINNKGIDSEASYPSTGMPGECHFTPSGIGATMSGCVELPNGDEATLQRAVKEIGPISVVVDASQPSFQLYKSGVYYSTECSSTKLDHAMLIVGYGTMDSHDYWIVRNNWGAEWGMKGYILMSRNRRNNCGIASSATYPLTP